MNIGTYQYTRSVAGPYRYPAAASVSYPFRAIGTQIQVSDGSNPVANAIVYRLPRDQQTGGLPFTDNGGYPYFTDTQGYLEGRGRLEINDHLIALQPISITETYTLYHTNATPTQEGVNTFIVTQPGVQSLQVSAANPLFIFNLSISLEWDASNDPAYIAQLKQNLQQASAALYDWTNGQVALGKVAVYQAREHWDEADIRIYASNQLRPSANRGGIVSRKTVLTHPQLTETITATTGIVRIGPTWNRYGDPSPIGDDWPNVLAHELGHYLLFLEDTYLGLDPNSGLLVAVESCNGTAMTDPYDEVNSELLYGFDEQWKRNCGKSLAELPDWELIRMAYPALHAPPPTDLWADDHALCFY